MLRRNVVNKPAVPPPQQQQNAAQNNTMNDGNSTPNNTTTPTNNTNNTTPSLSSLNNQQQAHLHPAVKTTSPYPTTTSNPTSTTSPYSTNNPNTAPHGAPKARLGIGNSSNITRYGKNNPKGYFSARVDPKTAFSIFDQYGRAQACPQCCTSRITQPGIKLKYATCCGRVLCVACRDSMCKPSLPCDTPNCIGMLDLSTWSDDPVDEYRYKLECQKRKELGKLGALEQNDFENGDVNSFDDYTEALQALLYDYTYGNIPLVADLGIARGAMERKYTVQIQRHEQLIQQRNAQAQWESEQLNQGMNLAQLQNLQFNAQPGQVQTMLQTPPHLEQLYREYQYYHNYAARLELECYTKESWEKEFLVGDRRAERFKTFTLIPPVPPIEAIPIPGEQDGKNNNSNNENNNNNNNDTKMTDSIQSNPTPSQLARRQTAFEKIKNLRKEERVQREREEQWDVSMGQAEAGGFLDLSFAPMTRQYNQALEALRYENDYDTF